MHSIREFHDVTPQIFDTEIRPLHQPAVLRGLAADWPLVQAARQGASMAGDLITRHATAHPLQAVSAPPEAQGRMHYDAEMRGYNFTRHETRLTDLVARLLALVDDPQPPALAAQGVVVADHLPGFATAHAMPLLPPDTTPRIWIGNAIKVATHNDPSDNIAVVATGRRRFTLFPPDQVANLYMGPFHQTPAGTPVSMVHVTAPDLARYPRFADAMASAADALLEPGDALYIPYAWYHHVEALDPFNILVNYWWNDARAELGSPWDAMLHGMMSLRSLPADQRAAWQAMFDSYVFLNHGDPAAHLPDHARGILAADTPADIEAMRRSLITNLSRKPAS